MKSSFSIKWKILLIFFIISLIMVAVVLGISNYIGTQNTYKIARNDIESIAQETKEKIDIYFGERFSLAKSISANYFLKEFITNRTNEEIIENIITTQLEHYRHIDHFFITNARGIVILTMKGHEKILGTDIKSKRYWELSKNDNDVYIDDVIFISPDTNKTIVMICAKIKDDNGKFIGLVCLPTIWEDFVAENIFHKKIFGDGYLVILDTQKRVLAHLNKDFILADFSKYDFIARMYNKDRDFFKYYFDRQKQWKFLGYDTLKYTNWKVAATVSQKSFTKDMVFARIITICIGTAIFLIGALIIYLFINSITGSIKFITSMAKQLSYGITDLAQKDIKRADKYTRQKDEIGDINKAFKLLIDYMQEKVNLAEKIADGDLNIYVNVLSENDKLGAALDKMVKSLNEILYNIIVSINQVKSGSSQVSDASQDLSQSATEQASSLEEIGSSIAQINSQAKNNSDNALQASQRAKSSAENTKNGNQYMLNLIESMANINTSAEEIKKIVKTIDDIAFQINLLALNANVEAARAGKYGRGFAVVAEEVRNLASRSAKSVKETTEMVDNATKNISRGNDLVEQTAKQFEEIQNNTIKMMDLIDEIASATKEQVLGMDQISIALNQIDIITQSNTASAEETASASQELSSQALELAASINKFKLHSDYAAAKNLDEEKMQFNSLKNNNNFKKNIINDNIINNKNPKEIIKLDDDNFGSF